MPTGTREFHPRHSVAEPALALYASRTGTVANLQAMAENGWRLLATPDQLDRYGRKVMPPWRYALDNGAWTSHAAGVPFDGDAFMRAVDALAVAADWMVLPDIVEGGSASLDMSMSWLPRVRGACPLLLPVQDGMSEREVADLIGPDLGVFVGGSTEWKERTLAGWSALARSRGAYIHVGRVNTRRRIRLCAEAGVDSFDGTSPSMYSVRAGDIARWAADEVAADGLQALLPLTVAAK